MRYTVYFFHMLEHKPESFPRRQSKRICCPAGGVWAELCAQADPLRHRVRFQGSARRAPGTLRSPGHLPGGRQPRDSLSEHAWWYTRVTKSHRRLLASGDRPCISLEATLWIPSQETPEDVLQNTALICPKFRMDRWKVFVSPSVGSRLSRSNLWSVAPSVLSAAYRVKHFITTNFSRNTAGCFKF